MIRIAALAFQHETVTFLNNDTTVEDFAYPGSPAKGEALLAWDGKSYMGGFVKVAREFADVALVGIESPLSSRTGTGSGWITEEAFETYVGKMVSELRALGPFDGVYLAVHGAMAVRGIPRPEAELARRVRAVVGPKARIVGTFDPHGNEDDEFFRHADMGFTGKYFPHYDSYLQGERAARQLVRMLRGDYTPTHTTIKVPILSPTVVQWTGASPWMDLVQRALVWEAREPDVFVNVFFGFPWSDVPDVGMTIQAQTNENPKLAQVIAEDMANWAWRHREALLSTTTILKNAEAVARATQAIASGAAPVVLADYSDRSGYATWTLREILNQDLAKTLIATIADHDAVAKLVATGAKVGDAFDMEIGGRVDSAGDPVRVVGTIVQIRERKGQRWFCIGFGRGNVLMLSPYLEQIMETTTLTALGIDLAAFDVFAIKSRVHFRRGFDDSGFAKTILLVEPEAPFMGTVHLTALHYDNVDLTKFFPYGTVEFG